MKNLFFFGISKIVILLDKGVKKKKIGLVL